MDLEKTILYVLCNISQINEAFLKIRTGNDVIYRPLPCLIKNDMI